MYRCTIFDFSRILAGPAAILEQVCSSCESIGCPLVSRTVRKRLEISFMSHDLPLILYSDMYFTKRNRFEKS